MDKTYAFLMPDKEATNVDSIHSLTVGKKVVTLCTLEQYEGALRSAEKSLEVDSNDAYAWYQKGARFK